MGLLEWLSICSDVERHVIGRYARDLIDNSCHAKTQDSISNQ